MDFDLLRDGEQFSNCLGHYQDYESTLDNMQDLTTDKIYQWNLDDIQINADLGLIPISSLNCDIDLSDTNNSSNVNIHQIINGLQQLDVEPNLRENIPEINIPTDIEDNFDLLNLVDAKNFDITTYLKDDHSNSDKYSRKHRAGVKKIDMKAQKYIINEEDDIDVETVSESGDPSAIIEAGDIKSLLEQFEASEIPDPTLPEDFLETIVPPLGSDITNIEKTNMTHENLLEERHTECKLAVKIKQVIEEIEVPIKEENFNCDVSSFEQKNSAKIEPEQLEINGSSSNFNMETMKNEDILIKHEQLDIINIKKQTNEFLNQGVRGELSKSNNKSNITHRYKEKSKKNKEAVPNEIQIHQKPQKTNCTNNLSNIKPVAINTDKNKQIMNTLPQELINRIRESGKRKCISVIEPIIPNKKLRVSRIAENPNTQMQSKSTIIVPNTVQLDHDYCYKSVNSKSDKKKDFDLELVEEERTVIEKQPMVKNADGKLMVSLLKVNTIREEKTKNKKKLNLEEYKKRREGIWKSQTNSGNNSPLSSTCSSPLPEDEEVRRRKHQEKLSKMALEVLRTPAKTEKKSSPPQVIIIPKVAQIPPDMEKKTLVSIGVNTEINRKKNVDPFAPVEQLEQIKPVLKKISNKINSNSLITSVIENIPRVINSCSPSSSKTELTKQEHGEDKTIVYLPKNRVPVSTKDTGTQTNISLVQQTKASRYRRRRNTSSSSSSSNYSHHSRSSPKIERERNKSTSSTHSFESTSTSRSSRSSFTSYSSRSYSRSRSRSTSPSYTSRKERERERLLEVEERRVIYVGRLADHTSRETLRKRFQRFGTITNISLHSRQHGDKYGFVTFANKSDAYAAIEHGNDDPFYPKYDLSFGGRRIFCQTSYADLDNMRDEMGYSTTRSSEESFDNLLKEVKEKLRKRKA